LRSLPAKYRTDRGTALIEFTLVFPIFFWLFLNSINFGMYMYGWVTVSNAARAVAQYQVYAGCAVATCPATPAYSSQISPLFTTDVSSLRGTAPTLIVCSNSNGTVTTIGGTGTCTPPADPEPSAFTLYSVDVTYTFSPLFHTGSITYLLPTTIHKQVLMRSMQ
jgi:Flp pilus assembly protein TadG